MSAASEVLLSRLVDALVTLPAEGDVDGGGHGAEKVQAGQRPLALLVQKNRREAALLVGGDRLVILLACHDQERPGAEVEARVEQALAAERDDVRRGARESVAVVVLVGGAAPIEEIVGALPAAAVGLQLALQYCRVAAGAVEQPAIPAGASQERRDRIEDTRRAVQLALTAALDAIAAGRVAPVPADRLLASERAGEHTLAAEGIFARRLDEVWPFVGVLMGALVLVWIAELMLGAGTSAVLSRMGSSYGRAVLGGQWWKVVCAGWLHAGFVHLAGNLVGLLLFLAPVSASLGRRRAFVLYALSCAGGFAFTAWLRPDEDGVGASGGIFGLMAATLCLGLRRAEYMPRGAGCGWAGFATVYLVLNLFASLKGGVSLLGHVGGGLTGAILVAGRLVTLGLPTLDAAHAGSASSERTPRRADAGPAWGVALSWLATTATVGVTVWAFVLQLARERPWVVRWPPPVIEASCDDTPYALSVPRSLTESMQHEDDGDSHEYTLGMLRLDPIAVATNVRPRAADLPAAGADRAAATAGTIDALLRRYQARWSAQSPGERGAPPTVVTVGDRRWVYQLTHGGSDGERSDHRYITADADHELDIIVYVDGEANARWIEAAAAVPATLRRTDGN